MIIVIGQEDSMSIQAVSFGKQAVTKNGNAYEKTNLGSKIGALAGAGFATYSGVKSVKALKNLKASHLGQLYKATLANLPEEVKTFFPKFKEYATDMIKSIKITLVPIIAVTSVLTILLGFGLGKIGDAIVNKVRANKADAQNV